MRSALLPLLIFLPALASAPMLAQAAEGNARPNIVLIVADDLGYGDLGCFGQEKIATPHLDDLASRGMRLTDFYAGSTVCAPSRCVLMTGLHTGHALIRGNGKDNLRPEDVTMAEVLHSAGYATGMFGKWGLGHEGSTGVPTKQGFDYFYGYLDQHHAHNYYPTFLMRNEERVRLKNVVPGAGEWGQGVASEKMEYSHDLIMAEALAWLEGVKEKPFFLFLPFTLPHANNEAGNKGMEVPEYGQYADKDWPEPQKGHAAMITRMDRDLGTLFAKLKEYGVDERTLIFFTSDNGPHREGGNNPDFANSSGPLTGIKRSLTEGGIRVPTIVCWPGVVKPGSESSTPGYFADLLPTFAEIGGAKDIPAGLDGVSLAGTFRGGAEPEERFLYWAFYEGGGARAGRLGKWKVVQQPINTEPRLYDLSQDIAEKNDLAEKHPEVLADLIKQMDAAYTPSNRWKFPEPRRGR